MRRRLRWSCRLPWRTHTQAVSAGTVLAYVAANAPHPEPEVRIAVLLLILWAARPDMGNLTGQDLSGWLEGDAEWVLEQLDAVRTEGHTSLTAPESKVIADAYGIAVSAEEFASDVDAAVAHAARFDGPVVLKIVSLPPTSCTRRRRVVWWPVSRAPSRCGRPSTRSSRTPARTRPAPVSTASRCRSCFPTAPR